MVPGRVLDVSALVDITVAKTQYSRSVVAACLYAGGELCIPATALAAVLSISPLATQIELFELISNPAVKVDDFTSGKVGDIAEILEGSRDVTAGHVIWCSRMRKWPVLTDRADELRAFDPHVLIDTLP
ncbi:hypothetical protein E1295_36105 [Nonomuraea mesophila]|uniref:Type II toxin-antitoxin system VapC family toxin n=1 Tax=Nonomuraea mesophila TaxID=2530382 RepID=A0A4R5ELC6_9ACTN|nr:hypothetical protein [Nonomuraea mesophila]TDE35358.1 hypothetical protein E1295_36105 [Nonomuraea mesophila]